MIGERVFLGLGSNIGDRRRYLVYALRRLEEFLENLRVSGLYETDPLYVTEQNSFLNAVAVGKTRLEPAELLDRVLAIENDAGRDRQSVQRRGPRVLDIDILLYGRRIIDTERLTCPHPLMRERLFVLVPLLELEPDCTDPSTGIPYREYRNGLEDKGYTPAGGLGPTAH